VTITSPISAPPAPADLAGPGPDAPGLDAPGLDADADLFTDQEAASLLRGAPWQRFVSIGDSVVEGIRGPAPGYRDLSWIDRLVAALRSARPDLVDHNLGRRGLLAADVRLRQLAPAVALEPDLAVVAAGGNDVFRDRFDTLAVGAELTGMVRRLRDIGCDVITIGLFDITRIDPTAPTAPMVSRRIRALSEVTAAVAARHGAIHIDFSTHPSGADPAIYADDRLHLNARGQALVAATTIRRLAEVLEARGLR
jgi:lysophospholipase L1-like esterase